MCGFSPGSLKLKLRGSRQTGHSSSSSVASWLETTGRGAATMAAKGCNWRDEFNSDWEEYGGGLMDEDPEYEEWRELVDGARPGAR